MRREGIMRSVISIHALRGEGDDVPYEIRADI